MNAELFTEYRTLPDSDPENVSFAVDINPDVAETVWNFAVVMDLLDEQHKDNTCARTRASVVIPANATQRNQQHEFELT